ncbi:hypothetical protein GCM10010961_15700 [Pseudodonghicola xiamenensis]|uniref:Uncharacterized protein n=1 Tax=Pseudodonghicola xiamenensis TaxID=337702 RepID=A0A8J3H5A6_9RHOB|nr:hypothetical protein GCM10010961_15700 [Pseudodonghicola xiamenensis]
MQSASAKAIYISGFRLQQKPCTQPPPRLGGNCQKRPGGGADIAMQDRSYRYQAGKVICAAGPAPNRAESCATSSSAGDTSPSDACAAAP